MQTEIQNITHNIAKTFVVLLKLVVSKEEYKEIVILNKNETIKDICHSHDFIEANEVMVEAFKINEQPFDLNDQEDIILWGNAWDRAQEIMQEYDRPLLAPKNEKLINALKAFNEAYNNLNKEWDNAEATDKLSACYPFESSFDEYDVNLWVDRAIEELS